MTLDQLNLVGPARDFAARLLARYPATVFASGRRDLAGQANAMAEDIVESGNPRWIADTYASSPCSRACQAWLDSSMAFDVQSVASGLLSVLGGFSDADLALLSRHLGGGALDLALSTPLEVVAWIRQEAAATPGMKLLTEEGGRPRLHVEFD